MPIPDPQPAPPALDATSDSIRAAALAMGFALVGFTPAAPASRPHEFRAYLADGKHASMRWLADTADVRLDITQFLPNARSLIILADQYPLTTGPAPAQHHYPARIAAYAQGRDYHKAISARLHRLADRLRHTHPSHSFRVFVDSLPVLEREHAARAALGWIGRNTLLIHPSLGSALLLGGIASTLPLAHHPHASPLPITPDHCGSCTRCIDACPTNAIEPLTLANSRSVDARRCISYLTIEHDSPIDPQFHESIADWLLGCDICQTVCPFNQDWILPAPSASADPSPSFPDASRARFNPAYTSPNTRLGSHLDALDILSWTPADRAANLGSSAVKRATLPMLKRNALIVLANSLAQRPDPRALDLIRRLASDPEQDTLVCQTALQVLERLVPSS